MDGEALSAAISRSNPEEESIMEPKTLVLYQIYYYDREKNEWLKSSWKMTPADAETLYANRQYKILPETKEELSIDGSFALPVGFQQKCM